MNLPALIDLNVKIKRYTVAPSNNKLLNVALEVDLSCCS